ncbi:hypothetical protein TWF730_010706 [Orbilia blumenaviensis]|uniref:Aminoglycoside phosphotransferase domain-containing protein n=1 Tax=Orbilia blumenaviensis TaxID=1796055 RepID=A0AAV9URL2_9PEZI
MAKAMKRKIQELDPESSLDGYVYKYDIREKRHPPWEVPPTGSSQYRQVGPGLRSDAPAGDKYQKRDYWEYSNSPPSGRWFNEETGFLPPPSVINYWTTTEKKERRRVSRIDLASRDVGYILRLCEKARGNYYQCHVDEDEKILVGCRNYIVTLLFDDGTRWLLKTGQSHYEWSKEFANTPDHLVREIATNLWTYENTGVPVPRIRLWDTRTSKANKFGKPWYVMDKLEGQELNTQNELLAAGKPESAQVEQEMRFQRHLARFEIELLRYPSAKGEYTLKKKAGFFHGSQDRPLQMVTLKTSLKSVPPSTFTSSLLGTLRHARTLLVKEANSLGFTRSETNLHTEVLNYLEKAIPKIIDPRFESICYLAHKDITDLNIICDRELQITGIIDWELAETVPLQAAINQPTTVSNHLLDMVPNLFKMTNNRKAVARAWKQYDRENQILRDNFIFAIEQLDDGVLGDESTPWTAGHKYVTGLYRVAHAVRMIQFFVEGYRNLLREKQPVRTFIISEMKKIAEQAVSLVGKGGV